MDRHSGFTLIELSIVICIIAILAAIAVPSMLRARMNSNEASAIENLRTITTAQNTYRAVHDTYGDFDALTDDGGVEGAEYLKGVWEGNILKSGYRFNMGVVSAANFTCFADPDVPDRTGERYFRADGSGTILYAYDGRPDDGSPAIE